ncbi:zinc ribbon domain-containing protein [Lactococcus garvieae]|uniref:Zinc-ribbon domain-containing protein n=1 Tax=Lactococcus garvieae TaxID=1363 RepID=A0A1I4GJ53_9LACT|nr:zinc ribbon domain-containing protein [Lactococcus garvieae]SFL29136.1 hypothetical protein SAMN05216438_10427 [Lactococcus garvieae]
MIKIPIIKRKPKFSFTFSQNQNFMERPVKDADELVNLIEDENYRLSREAEHASIVVTKSSLKTGEILFAQRFELPQEGKINWVSECEGFYASKPIPFELAEAIEEGSQIQQDQPQFKEEEIAQTLRKTAISQQNTEKATQQFCADCGEVIAVNAAFCQYCGAAQNKETSEQEPEELNLMDAEQPKLEQADLPEELKVSETEIEETESISEAESSRDWASHVVPEDSVYGEPQETLSASLDLTRDETISGLLLSFKENADRVLKDFSEKEETKINQELSELDRRSEISERVTKQLQLEEAQAKKKTEVQLSQAEQAARDEENSRHQAQLQKIEATFKQQKAEQLEALTKKYHERINQEISLQVEKETEQLAKVLSGKTAELELRKRELNKGLKERFEETLTHFNSSQAEMISQLNARTQLPKTVKLSDYSKKTTA